MVFVLDQSNMIWNHYGNFYFHVIINNPSNVTLGICQVRNPARSAQQVS